MKRLLVALLVLFSSVAYTATPVLPASVADVFAKAVQHGGFEQACLARPGGCPIPNVRLADFDDDNVAGMFSYLEPTVVSINTQNRVPGTLEFNATLVHEFVHYLQWVTGKITPALTCQDVPSIEVPAYRAASAYLAEFGIVEDFKDSIAAVHFQAAMCSAGF